MKNLLLAIAALALPAVAGAQDFLQQWRDSATRDMNEFRAAHRGPIEAAGWRFVTGTMTAEEVPVSDVFVKSVKVEKGAVRSASLLNALYQPVATSDIPEYRSTKLLVWFDCKEGSYEQHILERYATVDGTGNPVSRDAEKLDTPSIEMPGADPRSYEKPLLAAVCTGRP
ncbi:MAG TPA: surface-adhesin E family protein [Burkholderiales bacterium]|nr:surface-adhesin E family protein [Burkholderiales bacterium]